MQQRRFDGKTALVTGGARGIGRAICRTLAAEGARVAVNYRSSRDEAEALVREVAESGGTARDFQGDVSQPAEVAEMVRRIEGSLGPVDLLVNNAGIFHFGDHTQLSLETWRAQIDVNLTGAYLVTWAVKDGMIARRFGRIVNVSSIAALRPRPLSIAYTASKAGLIAFTKCCAEAFAPQNVRVNALAPGLIETDIIADVDPALRQKLIDATPVGRIGEPEEMATVVAFLLADDSSFMTGQTIVASGGRVMLP
jgi:3-oxoacyl-[acyl-carrier protein] reductase